MNFIKSKLTLRNILLAASVLFTLVGWIIYLVLSTTGYFVGKAPNGWVVALSIIYMLGTLALIAFDEKLGKFDTIAFFALAACIILSFCLFVLDKEEVVGEMLIPVNHPEMQVNAASTTIVGVVFYGIAFLLFAVSNFLGGKKSAKEAD